MGKIKSKLIRRTGDSLVKKGIEFKPSFEENKKILGTNMPSKKIRNQIAGYLSKVRKREESQEKDF
jgi:ribosomal protein S17E